jgi:SPP1 family predicted phage head-tail adaptor
MPSRAESVTQGLSMSKNQVRVRMRYRNDIDSSMKITVHRDTDQIMQIIGGPAQIDGRKQFLEMMCERISS